MRIIDARGKPPPQMDAIHRQYPPRYYQQIGTQYPHETTILDIRAFQERAEKEGAVAIFISDYGQSAYIPILASLPPRGAEGADLELDNGSSFTLDELQQALLEPPDAKGKEYWYKVNTTQKAILKWMRATIRILEVHSDGDLTFEAEGRTYVVTTKGELFIEVPRHEGNGPGGLPLTSVEDNLLKYYEIPESAD